MQVGYEMTVEDYVTFNDYVVKSNKMVRRNMLKSRLQGTLVILIAGVVVGLLRGGITPAAIAPFVIIAIGYFIWIPRQMVKGMRTRVRKMIGNTPAACGEKNMILGESTLQVKSDMEDSAHEYGKVCKVARDKEHDYIFVGEVEALILPHRAFEAQEVHNAFLKALEEKVTRAGGTVNV